MTQQEKVQKIVSVATKYVGQKEKPGNSGFVDPTFETKMRIVGFQTGYAWCALFTELVYREAYSDIDPGQIDAIGQLFSPMAVDTYRRFKNSGHKVDNVPNVGDVVIWKHGNGPSGHAGIVVAVGPGNEFTTIEGNTNAAGGREGEVVALKKRKTGQPFTSNGLNIVGFISPL